MKVLIIGAGIGGLCLAHGLRKAGIEVKVFEKQEDVSNLKGYGIHINANGRNALQKCLPPANWARFETTSTPAGMQLFFRDSNLELLAERDDAKLSGKEVHEIERRGIGRIQLRDILLDGLNDPAAPVIFWDKAFSHYIDLLNGRVRAHFSDGTQEEGDVLIGADGPRSAVRHQLLPHIKRLDLGISTIAGSCTLDSTISTTIPSSLSNGSLNAIIPASRGWMFISSWNLASINHPDNPTERDRRVIWAYIVPKADTHLIQSASPEHLRTFVLENTKSWSEALHTLISHTPPETITHIPLRSMPHLPFWSATTTTVLGDAIHNMTPMAGVGANTALRDAALLSDVLARAQLSNMGVVEAIAEYKEKMRVYANDAVGMSRTNAENAAKEAGWRRTVFRGVLWAAGRSESVMRWTVGRAVVTK